jgi:hypothetical protein
VTDRRRRNGNGGSGNAAALAGNRYGIRASGSRLRMWGSRCGRADRHAGDRENPQSIARVKATRSREFARDVVRQRLSAAGSARAGEPKFFQPTIDDLVDCTDESVTPERDGAGSTALCPDLLAPLLLRGWPVKEVG